MKKRFFYEHPIPAGIIAAVLGYAAATVIAFVSTLIAGFIVPAIQESDALKVTTFNGSFVVGTLIALIALWMLNKKNGYHPFKVQGTNLKMIWLFIGSFAVANIAAIVFTLATQPGGFSKPPVFTVALLVDALYAGINEEVFFRGIPMALMMRNKPTSRRITMMTVITSVIFGLVHLGNLAGGADVLYTILQTLNAIGIGLFFAGIYLRTGSILIPMVVHFLDDFIIFITQTMTTVANPNPTSPLDWVISACVMLLPFVFGVLLLRKKHHQEIINTWERIWTEQNAPAANIANE